MVLTFIQIFLIFTHTYLDVFANTLRFTYVPYISYATCARIGVTVFVQVIYMSLIHMCSLRSVMCPCTTNQLTEMLHITVTHH